jgi:hypothetical protein
MEIESSPFSVFGLLSGEQQKTFCSGGREVDDFPVWPAFRAIPCSSPTVVIIIDLVVIRNKLTCSFFEQLQSFSRG